MPDVNGTTDFSVLQNELKGRSTKIVLVAFDLLYLNGDDLRLLALLERKKLLKKLLRRLESCISCSPLYQMLRPHCLNHD